VDFDLVVVGGGPVGASLACALAGAGGLRTALLGAEPPPVVAPGSAFDARVYALSPGNVEFLRRIRAWQALDASRVTPVHAMRIFGDGDARIEFDAYAAGVPALAWTVEDAHLQHALWGALAASQGVETLVPAQFASLAVEGAEAMVRLADGRSLSARLVAAADGAASAVREGAGIAVTRRDYGQAAVVANFDCGKDHRHVAWQWFQGGAVLALLPLPGRRVSMIWSAATDEAARLAALSAEGLGEAASQASRGELGELRLITPARTYPLRRLSAQRMIAQRVALLGDAAHVIHPLAGQGLNLGLQDARRLAALVLKRRGSGDCGDRALLRSYERSRAEPILAMDFVVDGLFRLFSAPGRPARAARNAGLNLADRMTVLKNMLVRQAMA
jgi:ubiquinone biosynthesis UbiH/UbiF/VisC/COQ6 family hydroxylase